MPDLSFNDPFIFYAIFPNPLKKDLSNEPGLMTPQYLYDHNKGYLLDPILEPWRRIIVNVWDMYKQDPGALTRQEIIDALNIRLGPRYMKSIQLFRYIPSVALGWQLKLVMSHMAIFKIDLNNIDVLKYVKREDIDWGFDKHLPMRKLNRLYYEQVQYDEYTKYYKDTQVVFNKEKLLDQFNQITVLVNSGVIPKTVVKDVTYDMGLTNPFNGGL